MPPTNAAVFAAPNMGAVIAERLRRTIPLQDRPDLSIPEVMLLMKLGRKAIYERISAGRWRTVATGKRIRVVTHSIYEDLNKEAKRAR